MVWPCFTFYIQEIAENSLIGSPSQNLWIGKIRRDMGEVLSGRAITSTIVTVTGPT
jgi:hypothetical protein